MKTLAHLTALLLMNALFLMQTKPVSAQNETVKVIFDKGTLLPGWKTSVNEGAIKGSEVDGAEFTLEAWREGRDFWPRLSYAGPAIDVSAYTKLVFEIENTSTEPQGLAVAAEGNSGESVRFGTQLAPKTVSKVVLDISDGATIDASALADITCYMRQPAVTTTYILRRVTAIKNPDFISQRAALAMQLQEAGRSLQLLKTAQITPDVTALQNQLDELTTVYERRLTGYATVMKQGLLAAQKGISRQGMDSRAADLWLWTSPLGFAIREGTLPSPADVALKSLTDTVCLNQYKALCINISASAKAQSLHIALQQSGGAPGLFALRPALFSKARDGSLTADAIGQETTSLDLEVPAYQSQQVIVWINTKRSTARPGKYTAQLQVSERPGNRPLQAIPVNITVTPIRLASSLPVSISNWAYFYLGSTAVTAVLEPEAVANLRDYGMNTWNLDYSQVPLPMLDANGKYAGLDPEVRKAFVRVLTLLRGHPEESFVVWLGFQRENIRQALARPGVLEGYLKDLHAILDQHQVSIDKRYIMFWDEPPISEVRETIQWMKKVRKIDPTFKFYEDGSAVPTDKAELEEFLELTDRWFPNWEQFYIARPEEARQIQAQIVALNSSGLGFYRCLISRNNRGVNIYEYYRLMGWYTMQHGFETLGFWVYNVGDEDPWDGTKGSTSGGIVVYNQDGKLLTSRRWELFREGLDDYKLAQAAIGAGGIVDARKHPQLLQICNDVASHPDDAKFADRMRLQLIDLALKKSATTLSPD